MVSETAHKNLDVETFYKWGNNAATANLGKAWWFPNMLLNLPKYKGNAHAQSVFQYLKSKYNLSVAPESIKAIAANSYFNDTLTLQEVINLFESL